MLTANPDNFTNATLTAEAYANLGGGSGTFETNSTIADETGLGVDGEVDEEGNAVATPPGYTGAAGAGANRWIEVRPEVVAD